jgi:hypothetical protein
MQKKGYRRGPVYAAVVGAWEAVHAPSVQAHYPSRDELNARLRKGE